MQRSDRCPLVRTRQDARRAVGERARSDFWVFRASSACPGSMTAALAVLRSTLFRMQPEWMVQWPRHGPGFFPTRRSFQGEGSSHSSCDSPRISAAGMRKTPKGVPETAFLVLAGGGKFGSALGGRNCMETASRTNPHWPAHERICGTSDFAASWKHGAAPPSSPR